MITAKVCLEHLNFKLLKMEYNIINNEKDNQFELQLENEKALVAYKPFTNGIAFLHTEVPASMEGKGIGSALAKHVLEYAKTNHLKIVVYCPFIQMYMRRHPEYNELLR